MNQNEQQHHIKKYTLDKLEDYAHKSHLRRLFHASHLHRNLLSKSRHISKIYSISEDLVRQCISQLFTDIDQHVMQLHRLIYSQQFDDLIPLLRNRNRSNSVWDTMQIESARQLFPTKQQLSEDNLLENSYIHMREKLTPKHDESNINRKSQFYEKSFDLDLAYTHKLNLNGKTT